MNPLQQVEALLRDREFAKARTRLENISIATLCDRDKALYILLSAEAKLRLGQYDDFPDLGWVSAYYGSAHDDIGLARAKYLYSWLLVNNGQHFDAREVIMEAYLLYKRGGHLRGQGRCLNRLSLTCFQLGDMDAAFTYLERCVSIYADMNDDENRHAITINLGSLLYSAGHLGRAVAVYRQLDDSLQAWPNRRNVAIHYLQSAIAYSLLGRFDQAESIIDKARPLIDCFGREKAIYFENIGWIKLHRGAFAEAKDALEKGLALSLKLAPESPLVAQIKRRLGDACFGLGQYEQARRYTDEALIVAEKINERVEIAACYRIYAHLECKNGNHDKARQWYTKACDIFSMIGSRYELAATRYLAAMSGIYQNGERQALLYLAREYFESEDVRPYVEKINAELARVRSMPSARAASSERGDPPVIIAVNPAMTRLVELAQHIAPSDMSVLLIGPTGAGKDLLAQYIHYHSGRAGKFVSINAAAIPDTMIESELFGYKKGAYTGADKATAGLFEDADGGTLYLNEIADASPELQAKLLDVLETKTIRRLGERTERKIDFRLIAATNHDIVQLIREEKFRLDLYHRLNEIPIALPALSDRLDDIPALVEYFLCEAGATISDNRRDDLDRLVAALADCDWPGNVRELKSQVERLALLTGGDIGRMVSLTLPQERSEREQLEALLAQTDWNRSRVAEILGLSEGTVRHRMKKHRLYPGTRV